MCKPLKNQEFVEVLGALADACYAFPQLRVGQIIDNAITVYTGSLAPLCHITDEDLTKALRSYIKTYCGRSQNAPSDAHGRRSGDR